MSARNFEKALSKVLVHEGGYVNDPHDPGGPTNLGVTQKTLSAWLGHPASIADVRALTPVSVAPIYKKNYWDKVSGDDLPSGVDYAVFDYAVNSGVSRAAKALQTAVGAKADGIVGVMTLAKVGTVSPETIVARVCDGRLAFLKRLKTWGRYGKGWGSRVASVKTLAISMTKNETKEPVTSLPIPTPKASDDDQKLIAALIEALKALIEIFTKRLA